MTVAHGSLTSIHPGAHSDATSPSANANDLWVARTGSAPYQLYLRNAANSAWEAVGLAGSISGEFGASDFAPTGLTGATAVSRYVGATTSGAPASGTFAVGDFTIDRTGKIWVCTSAGTPGTWVQVGGSASLTTASAQLSADVAMASANTYYDGPSVSLAAGTWLVYTSVHVRGGSSGGVTMKLWDGTTVAISGYSGLSGEPSVQMALSWPVSPGSTTTYKVSAAGSGSGYSIRAQAALNAAGNTCSSICAVKVA